MLGMPQGTYERDSDNPVSEDVELLSFAPTDHETGAKQRHHAPTSWLRRRSVLAESKFSSEKKSDHFLGPALRLVWFLLAVLLTPISCCLHLTFGTSSRRNSIQQGCRLICVLAVSLSSLIALLTILSATFSPSYTNLPPHYVALRQVIESSDNAGRANPQDQTVLIAASLYDPEGELLKGAWADSVLQLVHILGPQNTHLSIYESDSGPDGEAALREFSDRVHSPKTIRSEDHVPVEGAPLVALPDGGRAVKRIEYLARARNLALDPLNSKGPFDKILYINDVFFDPIEAAQLLFLTNSRAHDSASVEKANYRAACAADFSNPFKYYDTLATRDAEGFSIGVPVYPFFTSSGEGESRRQVLQQTDAVKVKSCWGGMVAFDARYFQHRVSTTSTSANANGVVRFRSEPELDYEYSECCLIHADLAAAPATGRPSSVQNPHHENEADAGIFLNPYIRTAYDEMTFKRLWLGRRVEKILVYVQAALNVYANMPFYNERRTLAAGDITAKVIWDESRLGITNNSEGAKGREAEESSAPAPRGRWVRKDVPASPGGFCSIHHLMVRRLDPRPGETTWDTFWMPLSNEMLDLNGL